MAKAKSQKMQKNENVQPLEILSLLASLFYLHSFNTVLHHYSLWKSVEHPDVYTLAISLAITSYYAYKRKSVSRIGLVTITVLATVSIVWISGYRANFF